MKATFLYVTFPNQASARKIAKKLLAEKLIACVNIFPSGRSLFFWNGKITENAECYAILKTRKKLGAKTRARIRELHPYSVPCMAEFQLENINTDFMKWIESCTR
jgi:periplasmic divalent cation tolerance protein